LDYYGLLCNASAGIVIFNKRERNFNGGKEEYQAYFHWFWQWYLINPHKLKHPQESEGRGRYCQLAAMTNKA
jgi:hypothetical protein